MNYDGKARTRLPHSSPSKEFEGLDVFASLSLACPVSNSSQLLSKFSAIGKLYLLMHR